MPPRVDISEDELNDLYWNQELSTSIIAAQFLCNAETVRNRMKEYGIPRRTNAESQLGRKHSDESREKMAVAQRGRKVSFDTLKKQSDRHRNGKRSLYDVPKEEFEEMYCIQGMNQVEIANFFSCDRSCIQLQLLRHGIPLLSKSEACSIANIGRTMSPDNRQKASERNKGEKNYFFGKHFVGEDHPLFGKPRPEETRKKIGEANKGKLLGDKNHFFGKHFVGDMNPNWRGGISFEPYCPKFNEAFKESIREKFGRVCFLCPTTEEENGRKLAVHHVNYNKDCLCGDSECEFVPLCTPCHMKTNYNRYYWTDLIMSKLNNIKEVQYV
ncbi:hypothetical protein KAW18_16425 [candidate division WOR-3 bacterium]|nr:hypothetical protein [candidate division WOR-3 bacterium]